MLIEPFDTWRDHNQVSSVFGHRGYTGPTPLHIPTTQSQWRHYAAKYHPPSDESHESIHSIPGADSVWETLPQCSGCCFFQLQSKDEGHRSEQQQQRWREQEGCLGNNPHHHHSLHHHQHDHYHYHRHPYHYPQQQQQQPCYQQGAISEYGDTMSDFTHPNSEDDGPGYRSFSTGPFQCVLVPHGYVWQEHDCNTNDLTRYDLSAEALNSPSWSDVSVVDRYTNANSSSEGYALDKDDQVRALRLPALYLFDTAAAEAAASRYSTTSPSTVATTESSLSSSTTSSTFLSSQWLELHRAFQEAYSVPARSTSLPVSLHDSACSSRFSLKTSNDGDGEGYALEVKQVRSYNVWSADECQRLLDCIALQGKEVQQAREARAAAKRIGRAVTVTSSDGTECETPGGTAAASTPAVRWSSWRGKNWHRIAELVGNGRTAASCSNKYQKIMSKK